MFRDDDSGGGQPHWPQGFVLFHPEWGIYLGSCMGLGFWSHMDPAGQDSAVVFPTLDDARAHVRSWPPPLCHVSLHAVQVDIDHGGGWASIAACTRAGLPGWNPNGPGHGHPMTAPDLPPGMLLH